MKKIKCILIDDETASLEMLENLLGRHCPGLEVIGKATSVDEGYTLIRELSPQLVFLDIRMPDKSGFDLLRMFDKINFHVIFVSGFDQYAIHAFEFSAVDYILKPIDYQKLIAAVNKAEDRILNYTNQNIIHFIYSLDEKTQLIKNISVHHNDKVHIIDLNEICYIQALRGYSEIVTQNGNKFISPKCLSDYEELLRPYPNFLRANKSIIININFIKEYTKGVSCFITILNYPLGIEIPRRKKTDIIKYLKNKV